MKNTLRIAIIDTQCGNLFSLKAAFEKLGCFAFVTQNPDELIADVLVIPGQGRFATVMKKLTRHNWIEFLNAWKNANKPIIGICVGMQILFEGSDEDSGVKGLCWLKGFARRLDFPKKPMVGWAAVSSNVFAPGIPYFVNSYAITQSSECIATTNYGELFCAAVMAGSIIGFQFHPEKSSQYGLTLLNWAIDSTLSNYREVNREFYA